MSPAKRSNKEKEKVVVRRTTRSSVLQVSVEKNNNDEDNTEIVKEVDEKTEEVVHTTVIVEDADRYAEDLLVHLLDDDGDKILKSIPVKAGSAQKEPGSEPEKTAQVEKGSAREKQIETPSKGRKEPAQNEPETPAQEQHEPRAQEEEEDEETQEPESPIVYEEGRKPNKENTIQTPPREKEGPTDTAQQEKIKKRRGRKRRERRGGGGGEGGGYGRYIHKVLKQVHPELGVSSKAMTVLDNYIRDMFERLATEAARLGDYAKKRTLTSREVQGAVRLVLPGELGKHAIAEGSKAVSNFMAFDD